MKQSNNKHMILYHLNKTLLCQHALQWYTMNDIDASICIFNKYIFTTNCQRVVKIIYSYFCLYLSRENDGPAFFY